MNHFTAHFRSSRLSLSFIIGFLLVGSTLAEEDLTPQQRDLFEIHVRPVLSKHCIECHGATKQEGKLRLTSLESILLGGESGPAIVIGKPNESVLIQAVRNESLEMPPDNPLSSELVAGLTKWVAAGAPWPPDEVIQPTPKITQDDRDWWAYQPIADPNVPQVSRIGWCSNEIDRFVLARLEQDDISPAKPATRRHLLRRLSFGLTGLSPAAHDLQATSPSQLAVSEAQYTAIVDRLLGQVAFGEHQARFWLDLVRYADTDGYRADHARPEAKKYRDYVIRSFNNDKPYDQFTIEQLAGDEIAPHDRDAIIGTMYFRHGIYEHNQRDVETQWHEILNDITETTADVFLAQGVKCARCHDHKFDPILQKDYFRLKAFFVPLQLREDLPVADLATQSEYQQQFQVWDAATQQIRTRLHQIEYPILLKHATREGFDKFVPDIKAMVMKQEFARGPYERQIAGLATRQFDVHPEKLPEWLDEETENERQQLRQKLAEYDSLKPKPLPTLKFVASDVGRLAPKTFIPDDPDQEPIAPGFLTLLDDQPATIEQPPEILRSTGRRTALARWITDASNPLTARVIVNRIWQQHFGQGLVSTSSDFGRLGSPPSHPKLLDWLASRLIEDGWSLKSLHRRIVLSSTYRQSALRPASTFLQTVDPANRLLWRMNPRRLSAEEVRDAMLTASGELESEQRSIYQPIKRNSPDPLLALFDAPDHIRSTGKRHTTTTARQALLLTNGSWTSERAAAMAQRFADQQDGDFVWSVYEQLFARSPAANELRLSVNYLSMHRGTLGMERLATKPKDAPPSTSAPAQARTSFVHTLLNSNEMIYVD